MFWNNPEHQKMETDYLCNIFQQKGYSYNFVRKGLTQYSTTNISYKKDNTATHQKYLRKNRL